MSDQFTLSKSQLEKLSLNALADMHRSAIIAVEQQRDDVAAKAFHDFAAFIGELIYQHKPQSVEEWAIKVMAMATGGYEPDFPFDQLVSDANEILVKQKSDGDLQ